jgi:hypothetical protein
VPNSGAGIPGRQAKRWAREGSKSQTDPGDTAMPEEAKRYSAAWQQFLVARRAMLDSYDRAHTHAREQIVATHHGVVGEAAVRDWLATFLPKRYGVATGQIRAQGLPVPHQSKNFDVIIYDELDAPTLWVEDNKDKSESARIKIIPAEFVRAIIEVKSSFSRATVREAIAKLEELEPLTSGIDPEGYQYPRFLPSSAILAMLFFELRSENRNDVEALNLLRDAHFQRRFYGAAILRGEGSHPADTALIAKYRSDVPHAEIVGPNGLLQGFVMTASKEQGLQHIGASLMWGDVFFSQFAFDLLAMLNGTYRPGSGSSLHGLEIRGSL